jgi:hypothetical protein
MSVSERTHRFRIYCGPAVSFVVAWGIAAACSAGPEVNDPDPNAEDPSAPIGAGGSTSVVNGGDPLNPSGNAAPVDGQVTVPPAAVGDTGGALVGAGGTTGDFASTGGVIANTGGAPGNTGGALSNTGGALSNTGGTLSNTGGPPSNTGGIPASTGGAPAATGGFVASTGGVPAATGGRPEIPQATGGNSATGGASGTAGNNCLDCHTREYLDANVPGWESLPPQ